MAHYVSEVTEFLIQLKKDNPGMEAAQYEGHMRLRSATGQDPYDHADKLMSRALWKEEQS